MSKPITLQNDWSAGMKSDFPRERMPPNSVWNISNLIPNLEAGLRGRGGWAYASNDISAVDGTVTSLRGVAFVPTFAAGNKLFAISQNSKLFAVNESTLAVAAVGAIGGFPRGPLNTHRGYLILTGNVGQTVYKYDGAALSTLGATAPDSPHQAVYKDRLLLGRTVAQPQRLYFSDPGDPTVFATGVTFIDMSAPITGLFAMSNAVLVWSLSGCERIRGSIPPPDSDMVREPTAFPGCIDARSIAAFEDTVIWADDSGVYRTDGSALEDLTVEGGMKTAWLDAMSGYNDTNYTVAGGVHKGYYIVRIMNGITPIVNFVIDVKTKAWFKFGNTLAVHFAGASGTYEELYFASRIEPRLVKMSPCWLPVAANKRDGDNGAIAPIVESAWFTPGGYGKKTWKQFFISYDLRDAAADNPTLDVYYLKNPEDALGSAVAAGPSKPETSKRTRAHFPIRQSDEGIAYVIQVLQPYSDFRLYSVEADIGEREGHR